MILGPIRSLASAMASAILGRAWGQRVNRMAARSTVTASKLGPDRDAK